jgi:hypothetical protein
VSYQVSVGQILIIMDMLCVGAKKQGHLYTVENSNTYTQTRKTNK